MNPFANTNEKLILKVRRFWGFGVISIEDLKNLRLLNWSFLGIISGIFSWRFFGIGVLSYPLLGLKCYQGVNIYLTEKRIYSKYILINKIIFEISLSNILSFREVPLRFGSGILINYKEKDQEKNVVLIFRKKDAERRLKELDGLMKTKI